MIILFNSLLFLIRWEFETEHYDISYSVTKEGTLEPLKEMERVDSHLEPIEGQIVCPEAGTCEGMVLIFI